MGGKKIFHNQNDRLIIFLCFCVLMWQRPFFFLVIIFLRFSFQKLVICQSLVVHLSSKFPYIEILQKTTEPELYIWFHVCCVELKSRSDL